MVVKTHLGPTLSLISTVMQVFLTDRTSGECVNSLDLPRLLRQINSLYRIHRLHAAGPFQIKRAGTEVWEKPTEAEVSAPPAGSSFRYTPWYFHPVVRFWHQPAWFVKLPWFHDVCVVNYNRRLSDPNVLPLPYLDGLRPAPRPASPPALTDSLICLGYRALLYKKDPVYYTRWATDEATTNMRIRVMRREMYRYYGKPLLPGAQRPAAVAPSTAAGRGSIWNYPASTIHDAVVRYQGSNPYLTQLASPFALAEPTPPLTFNDLSNVYTALRNSGQPFIASNP